MSKKGRKNYREWILSPVLVAIEMQGFRHHEMAVQACISIESTNDVDAYIVSNDGLYNIALEKPSEFDCECARNTIEHLLEVDSKI